MALGSGFIIGPAGSIVTNNHVVANADKVTVIFQDNSRHAAKVIGRDEKTDISLLKIDSSQKLAYVTWGNSDDSKVGDWVVAVGNPFGLGGSVTAGSPPHSDATSMRARTTISCKSTHRSTAATPADRHSIFTAR